MKTVILVNRDKIEKGEADAISVNTATETVYCSAVTINGPSRVVYDALRNPPLPYNIPAHCWIETESEVIPCKVTCR